MTARRSCSSDAPAHEVVAGPFVAATAPAAFLRILDRAQEVGPEICVACGVEQPDDVLWPNFIVDGEDEIGEPLVVRIGCCPSCEPLVDRVVDELTEHPRGDA